MITRLATVGVGVAVGQSRCFGQFGALMAGPSVETGSCGPSTSLGRPMIVANGSERAR